MKYFKLSRKEFAEKMEIQISSISHLLSERNKPSIDFLTKLNQVFPEVNLHWFISGNDTMIHEKQVAKNNVTNVIINDSTINKCIEVIKIYDDGTFEVLKHNNS